MTIPKTTKSSTIESPIKKELIYNNGYVILFINGVIDIMLNENKIILIDLFEDKITIECDQGNVLNIECTNTTFSSSTILQNFIMTKTLANLK